MMRRRPDDTHKRAREGYGFVTFTVVYEIPLDKYWGSIDARREGFFFSYKQICCLWHGMIFFLLFWRLYSKEGKRKKNSCTFFA
ncbi:hypothetical protein V8C37DRAFT_370744 [Trichoderma ceciliae]